MNDRLLALKLFVRLAHLMQRSMYGVADGAQMYGGRQPSGYLAPDDTVWFPSNRGPVRITPMETHPETLPKVLIEQSLKGAIL